MIAQILEGEHYRRVRNFALAGLAAGLMGGFVIALREHQKVWINNCIADISEAQLPLMKIQDYSSLQR